MGQDLSKMDDQEIKIERVDFVIESDDAFYDEYNTDEIPINQLESTSHAGSGKKSAKLATIANMEKTFDEMRKYPQFAYLLNFVSMDDFLQHRATDEQVDIFLERYVLDQSPKTDTD